MRHGNRAKFLCYLASNGFLKLTNVFRLWHNLIERVIGLARVKRVSKVRYYSPKRRAIYAKGDDIIALVLFEMHAWTCCICQQPINKHFRKPNLMAATIEHIRPLSKGGTHTWDNVKPAHASCNFRKGDTDMIASEPVLGYA